VAALKIAVLISGSGSNLQALIDASRRPDFGAEIGLVLSNREDAFGLVRARDAALPAEVISHRDYHDRDSFDAALDAALRASGAELVCLAGFMRILGASFVARWQDRLLNIHPSLLPAFKGLNVHQRVLDAGVRLTGCTVHYVRAAVDAGPIVVQGAVPVLPNDTAESLEARVHEVEHRCYPLAVSLIAHGHARLIGERVRITTTLAQVGSALISPSPASR
jgi:phosphoribosylglycinamide formyltransferase-1